MMSTNCPNISDWDIRFLELARHISQWSKDPSTKTGSVITKGKRVVSIGYNGFPEGIEDTKERLEDRELKYQMMIHCERNALLFANDLVQGCTLYTWPFISCPVCAAMIIQSGIKRHVAPDSEHPRFGTKASMLSVKMFEEARVQLNLL